MKKLVMLISALLMVCLMATACGGDKSSSSSEDKKSDASVTSTQSATKEPTSSTEPVSSTTTSTSTPVQPEPPTPVAGKALVSSDVAPATYTEGMELAPGFVAGPSKKGVIVDTSSAVSFGSYKAVTNRMKLGGQMDATKKNSIKFTVEGACTLTVWAKGGSSTDTTRGGWVINEAGAEVCAPSAGFACSGAPTSATFNIPAAGTYYFGGNVNGINVYAMIIS